MRSDRVAFLFGVGVAVKSLLKNARLKVAPFPAGSKYRGYQGHSSYQGEEGRHIRPGQFVSKWSRTLRRKVALALRKGSPRATPDAAAQFAVKPLSLRIAAAINFLYWPFFWSGIAACVWFGVDSILRLWASTAAYQSVVAVSEPVLILVTPSAVGFWTNWLAVKMLFHPRRKNAIWWGLVPARRSELIDGIAAGILKRLISPEIIHEHLHKSGVVQAVLNETALALKQTVELPRFRAELKALVCDLVRDFATRPETRRSVEEFVRTKISEWTGVTFGAKIAEWTKNLWGPMVVEQVLQTLPDLPKATDSVLSHLESSLNQVPGLMERENNRIESFITKAIVEALHNLDIKQVVKAQLGKMDELALEKMLASNVTTELKFIQTSGGVFGLLAGVAFVYPASRPLLLITGLALWIVYRITVKKGPVAN
jgi:uncharacterized membrane protein YheB (UPF0754 family)